VDKGVTFDVADLFELLLAPWKVTDEAGLPLLALLVEALDLMELTVVCWLGVNLLMASLSN